MVTFAGVDGSGKTTLASIEVNRGDSDRCTVLDELTMTCDYSEWPDDLGDIGDTVILTATLPVLIERIRGRGKDIDLFETPRSLFYFDCRFREIAAYYGIPIIDTSYGTPLDNWWKTSRALKDNKKVALKDMTPEYVDKNFKLITEGESKRVYQDPNDEGYCYIVLKDTIYSHSMQSTGEIDGLAAVRAKNTRYFLNMLRKNMLPHAYVAVNDAGVIYSKKMRHINPLEVVVKEYVEGTDKHSYYKYRERYTTEDGRYLRGPYVRFDWRNPNHLDEDGVDIRESLEGYYEVERDMGKAAFFEKYLTRPMGDKTISRHIIDGTVVSSAENIEIAALKTFNTIKYYLAAAGLVIKDVCFMFSEEDDGTVCCWSELNQDCMRVTAMGGESLDKDVWRTGGSAAADALLDKWNAVNERLGTITGKIEFDPENDNYLFVFDYEHVINSYLRPGTGTVTHRDLYLKIMRGARPRRFVVVDDVTNPIFPDNLWTATATYEDKAVVASYPHIEVEDLDGIAVAIGCSARRVLLPSYDFFVANKESLPDGARLIVPVADFGETVAVFNTHPDIAVLVTDMMGAMDLGLVAANFGDTRKVFCDIAHHHVADLFWAYGFTLVVKAADARHVAKKALRSEYITMIYQNYDGTVVDVDKVLFDTVTFSGQAPGTKYIIDNKNGDTVLVVGDFPGTKTFSNQSLVKSNIISLYKSVTPLPDAGIRLTNTIWDPSENPEQLLTDFLSFIKYKGIDIGQVLNGMNARRWDIVNPKATDKGSGTHFRIAITSSKYASKTEKYILDKLGVRLEAPTAARALTRDYTIVDEERYRMAFGEKTISFFLCKPKDIPYLVVEGVVDGAITYNTVMGRFNVKECFKEQFPEVDNDLKLCLIKRAGERLRSIDVKKVASEHPALLADYLNKNWGIDYDIVSITGSSESFLVDKELGFDLADAVVESGKTIKENGLEIYKTVLEHLKIALYTVNQ